MKISGNMLKGDCVANIHLSFFMATVLLLSLAFVSSTFSQEVEARQPTVQATVGLKPGFTNTVKDVTEVPNYALLLENEEVRIFRVEIPPKGMIPLHWHEYDYLLVPLGEGEVSETIFIFGKSKKTANKARLEVFEHQKVHPDELSITQALMAHEVTNEAPVLYRAVVVELKHGGKGKHGVSTRLSLAQAEKFSVPTTKKHALAIVLEPCELSLQVDSQEPARRQYSFGEVLWMPAGVAYTLTNLGGQPASLLFTTI